MKKINENFVCSDDCEYSLGNNQLCFVTKGAVWAVQPGAVVFANGENTKA